MPNPRPLHPVRRTRLAALAGLGAAITAAAAGVSLDDAPGPEHDPAVLEGLGSDDHDTRRAATVRMLESRTLDPPTMIRLARQADLPLEARYRMVMTSFQTYVNAPLGALGVSTNPGPGGRGLVVDSTVPGFETERRLRSLDLLLNVAGVELTRQGDLAAAVQRRSPGDRVTIVFQRAIRDENGGVMRDPDTYDVLYGEEESIELALGDFRNLRSGGFNTVLRSSDVAIEKRNSWAAAVTQLMPTPRRLAVPDEAVPAVPARRDAAIDAPGTHPGHPGDAGLADGGQR